MDFFEFILIIISVIYALCVAPLLSGVARVLQFDGEVKHFLPQAAFALFLFLLVVLLWWSIWWFRDVQWQFATYLFIVTEPLIMFLACSLVFPNRFDGDRISMESHYYKVRVPLLTLILILAVLISADGVVMGIEPLWNGRRYGQLFGIALVVWALIDKRSRAQNACSLGLIAIVLSLIAGWFSDPAN